MREKSMIDRMLKQYEREELSRRRMIRDVCAATGWVFLTDLTVTRAAVSSVTGDPSESDPNYGSIRGRIVLEGTAPKREEVDLEKTGLTAEDMKWFKSMGPIVNQEWVVDPKSKAIQWVYVWLLPENAKDNWNPHESLISIPKDKKLVIVDQEPTGYVPHCLALQLGQGILMRNQGPVSHVFNFSGFENESFNKSMPPKSEIAVPDLKLEKSTVQINCPPHPWERMLVRMFPHPYFAVSREDGTFEINMIPKGKCRLVVWHEKAGFLGGRSGKDGSTISVEGAAVTDLGDLKLKPKTT